MKFEYQWRQVQFNDKNIERRINSSIVSANNTIFLFGGKISSTQMHFNDIFQYQSAVGVWHELEVSGQAPSPRCKSTLKYHGQLIYLYGGSKGNEKYNDIYTFHTVNMEWSLVKPKDYAPAPDIGQPILAVELKFPYFILLYNGIQGINSPIIWVFNFNDNEWRCINFKTCNWTWTSKFNACMSKDYIYILGRTKFNETPFLTECNFTKLIKQGAYDDVPTIAYAFSNWKDAKSTFGEWFCHEGYDGKIMVVYNVKNCLHSNKVITIDIKKKTYYLNNLYRNLTNFQNCSKAMSGGCLVAVGQLYGNNTQKLCYINAITNRLPARKYKPHEKQHSGSTKEDQVQIVINGVHFNIKKDILSRHLYFQNLFNFNDPEKKHFEITIMDIKEQYIKEMMSFIEGIQLTVIDKQNKKESFIRLIHLAYLADYFCIDQLKCWVQDDIYDVSENQNNFESIVLAKTLNLSYFEEYCSQKFLKCLIEPKQIRSVIRSTYSSVLSQKVKEYSFDLEHRLLKNSIECLGSNYDIPRQRITTNQIASDFLTQFHVMMKNNTH